MTYLQFHLVFMLPALALAAAAQRRPIAGIGARQAFGWLGAVCAIAFVYTTPWDNYLVYRGVWTYPPGRVLATIGYVPVEEYAFFLLQPILAGLVYFALRGRDITESPPVPMPRVFGTLLVAVPLLFAVIGVLCLLAESDHFLYMGLILTWACPVLAGMAKLGADKVWADRERVGLAVAIPTLYLWIADRTAIANGIWDIVDPTSLGIDPLGLPIEEATFFLVTNLLCVWALALFLPSPRNSRA